MHRIMPQLDNGCTAASRNEMAVDHNREPGALSGAGLGMWLFPAEVVHLVGLRPERITS